MRTSFSTYIYILVSKWTVI